MNSQKFKIKKLDLMQKRSSKICQQQQQQLQIPQDSQSPYKSHVESTLKKNKTKLSKKHIIRLNATSMTNRKHNNRPSGESINQNLNYLRGSSTKHKVRPTTAYSNLKPNSQNKNNLTSTDYNCMNNREVNINDYSEIPSATDEFFCSVRNATETAVKDSLDYYFHNLNNKMTNLEHKVKKLISGLEILATDLNNKISYYAEENNRKLSQVCMKLERDKIFYQNLNPILNRESGNVDGGNIGGGDGSFPLPNKCRNNRKSHITSHRNSHRNSSSRFEMPNPCERIAEYSSSKLPEPIIGQLQTICEMFKKIISNSNNGDNNNDEEVSSSDNNICTKRNNPEKTFLKPSSATMTATENEHQQQHSKQETNLRDDDLKYMLDALYKRHNGTANDVYRRSSKGMKKSLKRYGSRRNSSGRNNNYLLPSTDENAGDSNQSTSRSTSPTSVFKND